MKKIGYIALLFTLVACEDKYEDVHRYYRPFSIFKDYPIYLDASEILVDIQVLPSITYHTVFKIVANDKYLFVGEQMKGIHVYEKSGLRQAVPLCFIECRYLKAFDVSGDILYANNFVDLLVIDVENPLQATIKHREKEYFNQYLYYDSNIPKLYNTNLYLIGYNQMILNGFESDRNPAPDFGAYDKLFENMVVKEIPDTLQVVKPYVGIANADGELFTLGYTNLAQCSYTSQGFKSTHSSMQIPGFASLVPVVDFQYKDGWLFVTGWSGFVFFDIRHPFSQNQNYQSWHFPSDVVSVADPSNGLVILSQNDRIEGIIVGGNYWGMQLQTFDATSMINVDDTILALGTQLTLYRFLFQDDFRTMEQVKSYPQISGMRMLRDHDTLIIARTQGLSFYDISDLENITQLQ